MRIIGAIDFFLSFLGEGGPSSEEIQEKCPLLFESLKGLAQFAHVLSVEYFQDVLEVSTCG